MKTSRLVGIVAAVTIGLGSSLVVVAPANADPVAIPDTNLASCVQSDIGLGNLLSSLTGTLLNILLGNTLSCVASGITDVTGLDIATGLDSLNLNGNAITDLSSLGDLDAVITATGQLIDLGNVDAGEAIVLPVITGLNGAVVPLLSQTGAAVGTIENGTVTFLGDGLGQLTFAVGNFTGTLFANVTSKSFGNAVGASITGATEYGSTLAVDTTGWPTGTTFTYAWSRGGVTTATYSLGAADIGERITVDVTGHDPAYHDKTVITEQTNTIRKATIAASPVPTISGSTTVGSTLTVSPGSWSSGVTLTYQWYRAGSPVPSSKASTFAVTAADLGKVMTVSVQGTRENYTTVTRTSVATAAVTNPILPDSSKPGTTIGTGSTTTTTTTVTGLKTFKLTYLPKITGTAKVGKKLTAVTTKWGKKVTFRYQWKANGKKIAKATSKSWKVTKKYVGKKITVQVTAKLSGYNSAVKTSKSTKKVAR